MNSGFGTGAKVGGFVVALAAVFGLAVLLGRTVGPVAEPEPAAAEHAGMGDRMEGEMTGDGHSGEQGGEHGGHEAQQAGSIPGGLMVSEAGYTLRLHDTQARPGHRTVEFTIDGPDGEPVTSYDVEHHKRLHLIAVRRDFTGFQHVHPVLDRTGTWSIDLDLTPGAWRIFADFKPTGGDALTLGGDLAVSGYYQPAAPEQERRTSRVDGYAVTLAGNLSAGADAKLTVQVTKNGKPVTDLQPYLGAYGHLVALRAGDLAYLHVHPDGEPGDGVTEPGPRVVFYAAVPSDGRYHLYLDFKHRGVVRTAAFTVDATGSGHTGHTGDAGHDETDNHGH